MIAKLELELQMSKKRDRGWKMKPEINQRQRDARGAVVRKKMLLLFISGKGV